LIRGLRSLGIEEIVPGSANFVLCHLEADRPTAAALIKEARESGVFLRDVASMGTNVGARALRIAVKDRNSSQIVLDTLERVLCGALQV
jgi:histidinol-phosphate/aromatic aminotransferase/cobyric acid decarboxylase-like protein